MKQVISDTRVPIKIWSNEVEAGALQQLKNTANLPFVFKHVAVMPDVHWGMGATIGSVIATQNAVCPAAVGVDIGCGMMAVKLKIDADVVREFLPQIRHSIERAIPLGPGRANQMSRQIKSASINSWTGWSETGYLSKHVNQEMINKAVAQMGSLGGGNHFIEICLDTDNNVWAMLHSGSRGFGNIVARKHIDSAKQLLKWHNETLGLEIPDKDLAFFTSRDPEYQAYMTDLAWCQNYAKQNRIEMMGRILREVAYHCNENEPIKRLMEVNCHHNYAETENHFGKNVLITRKGAVRARKGDMGIIPGSMGAKSFIVRGLGNPDSFHSCSHGAGRKMSRKAAKAKFTIKDLEAQTAGVNCRKDIDVLDEIPGAYKDIDEVMNNQSDLVEVVAQLKQIMCVKGA